MTDDHEQDPVLDPGEDERIRALLAALGTAPDASTMPPEVAARLDDTLAELVAERAEAAEAQATEAQATETESADGTVVPLRRRWAPRAAAAAAAVIVVGAGGVAAANLGLFNGGAQSDSSAGSTSSKAESLQDSSTPPAAPESLAGTVPAISAAGFEADVARLLRYRGLANLDSRARANKAEDGATADSPGTACAGPLVSGAVQTTPVLYDGRPAVLVVHPPKRGVRLVEAWTCTGDRLLDSARVPAVLPATGKGSPGSSGLASPSPSP